MSGRQSAVRNDWQGVIKVKESKMGFVYLSGTVRDVDVSEVGAMHFHFSKPIKNEIKIIFALGAGR